VASTSRVDSTRKPARRGHPVILISTHREADYADLIAASPVVGFLRKSSLSARAIRDLLGISAGGEETAPFSGPPDK
jgi:hypothetical protein